MRKVAFILGCFFSLVAYGQRLDPAPTGKDSIAVVTSMVVHPEKFTTAEIFAFTRTTSTRPGFVFNSDTETLWAWTGTEWKDLGLAPIAGGITIDQTIQNGSTNPVENNAVNDRFIKTVDEAPDSPHNDIEWWFGNMEQYGTADKTNPRRFFYVSDSIYDPGPDGDGDGLISNMVVNGNILQVTGQGGAFNGELTLPSGGGGSDDQTITQSFSNSTYDLTTTLESANTVVTPLDILYQDAENVPFEDQNTFFNANDVQEVIDEMFEEGTGSAPVLLIQAYGGGSITNVGQFNFEYKRIGKTVFLQGWFNADNSFPSGVERWAGGNFLITIPSADLPPYFSPLGKAPLTKVNFDFSASNLYPRAGDLSTIRSGSNTTILDLSYAIQIPDITTYTNSGGHFLVSATYTTSKVQ